MPDTPSFFETSASPESAVSFVASLLALGRTGNVKEELFIKALACEAVVGKAKSIAVNQLLFYATRRIALSHP